MFPTVKSAQRRHVTGFTLLELLVVLTIMGILLGGAVLGGLHPLDRTRAAHEQFARHLNAQADAALLTQHTYGIGVGRLGYRVWRRSDEAWMPLGEWTWKQPPERFEVDHQLISLNDWPSQPQMGLWADGTVADFLLVFAKDQIRLTPDGTFVVEARP